MASKIVAGGAVRYSLQGLLDLLIDGLLGRL